MTCPKLVENGVHNIWTYLKVCVIGCHKDNSSPMCSCVCLSILLFSQNMTKPSHTRTLHFHTPSSVYHTPFHIRLCSLKIKFQVQVHMFRSPLIQISPTLECLQAHQRPMSFLPKLNVSVFNFPTLTLTNNR